MTEHCVFCRVVAGEEEASVAYEDEATVARVARAAREALAPDGINVWQSNGAAAGQEVFHLHLNVLLRRQNDGLLRFYPSRPAYPSRGELEKRKQP